MDDDEIGIHIAISDVVLNDALVDVPSHLPLLKKRLKLLASSGNEIASSVMQIPFTLVNRYGGKYNVLLKVESGRKKILIGAGAGYTDDIEVDYARSETHVIEHEAGEYFGSETTEITTTVTRGADYRFEYPTFVKATQIAGQETRGSRDDVYLVEWIYRSDGSGITTTYGGHPPYKDGFTMPRRVVYNPGETTTKTVSRKVRVRKYTDGGMSIEVKYQSEYADFTEYLEALKSSLRKRLDDVEAAIAAFDSNNDTKADLADMRSTRAMLKKNRYVFEILKNGAFILDVVNYYNDPASDGVQKHYQKSTFNESEKLSSMERVVGSVAVIRFDRNDGIFTHEILREFDGSGIPSGLFVGTDLTDGREATNDNLYTIAAVSIALGGGGVMSEQAAANFTHEEHAFLSAMAKTYIQL